MSNQIDVLKKFFGEKTDKGLARALNVKFPTNMAEKGDTGKIRPATLRKALALAQERSIKPIVEYYPIDGDETSRGKKYNLFDPNTDYRQHRRVKEKLNGIGVYVFYDSQAKAIYVGKTKSNLWNEMTHAYNNRTAEIRRVPHPEKDVAFKDGRPTKDMKTKLYDVADYFSAYEVATDMIHNAEALLLSAFMNSLIFNKIAGKIKSK